MDESELKRLLEASAAETRRHFDTVAEGLRDHVGLAIDAATTIGEKVDRLSVTMREEFVEVRSMIRFSYAELDRRLRTLEDVGGVAAGTSRKARVAPAVGSVQPRGGGRSYAARHGS